MDPPVGLVPAAGSAERLQPLEGSKELVAVGGRPVMDYLVERMRVATSEVVVVTRPDKADVADYARRERLSLVEATPTTVSESLLAGLRTSEADTALLGFPDTIWEPLDGFVALLEALVVSDVALGVFDSAEPERSDVVRLEGDRVLGVDVKPEQPRSTLIWGCAAARTAALEGLAGQDQPGHLFDELAQEARVVAVRFPGEMIDVGTPAALDRARRLLG